MERITKLPESLLIELPLDEEQERIFIEQMNRYNEVKEMEIETKDLQLDENGRVVLKKGTLIHGTSGFNVEVIDKIKNNGILTGQMLGIPEDGETFYCADFHRVNRDMSMEEYNKEFTYVDGRCPFGNGIRGSNTLAFIVEPSNEALELLSYDCYRDTKEGDIAKNFTNVAGLLEQGDRLSSILYGVPSNLFTGIVLGNGLLEKKEVVELIVRMFPDCYISTMDGVIIYNPSIDMTYNEVVNLRAQKYVVEFKKSLVELELIKSREENRKKEERYGNLVDTMIMTFPLEDVARMMVDNRMYQGNIESTMRYLQSRKDSLEEKKKSAKI